jgi:hypothetical protein
MNIIDILILVVTIYLIYIMVKPSILEANTSISTPLHKKYKTHERNKKHTKRTRHKKHKKYGKHNNASTHMDPPEYDNKLKFVDMQFHNDYKEIDTAIVKMSDQKQLFNTADVPVNHTKPGTRKTDKLIKYFMTHINASIRSMGDNPVETAGWNIALPNNNTNNGWDKHMNSLGLPSSIYKTSAGKSALQLLETKEISAMETENDMRITCVILCKKQNVRDNILLKINFWIDKKDINEDRNLLNDKDSYSIDNDDELKVVIENIFIIGYYVVDNVGSSENFYEFKNITGKDGMMNQEEILKQLVAKRKARAVETGTSILSPRELEQIKAQIPHMTNFEEYRNENNIFSDDSEES